MRLRIFFLALALFVSIVFQLTACDQIGGGPEQAARTAFDQFAKIQGIPYQDISLQTLKNDGTYATVRITVWLRPSAQSDWTEEYADVEVRNIGNQWQASALTNLTLTEAQQQRTNATATARAQSTAAAATATIEVVRRIEKLVRIVSVSGISFDNTSYYKSRSWDMVIGNDDHIQHSVLFHFQWKEDMSWPSLGAAHYGVPHQADLTFEVPPNSAKTFNVTIKDTDHDSSVYGQGSDMSQDYDLSYNIQSIDGVSLR